MSLCSAARYKLSKMTGAFYSLDLQTTKDYSLELIDTLRIRQIHSSIAPDIWKTKNQVVYTTGGILGFAFTGNFVNIYSDYDLTPGFTRKFLIAS
jgi:hypothetical protein